MPFGGLLIGGIGAGLSGLAGLFGGGKQQKQATNQTTTQSGSQSGTFNNTGTNNFSNFGNQFGSSTPVLSPFQQALARQFTSRAQTLDNQAADMSGYTAGGLEGIDKGAQNANNILNATLASRGLAYSPAASTANTQATLNTIGQKNQFLQQIPLLQRQLQQQSLDQLMKAFQVQPVGTQTTQQTTSGGQQNTSQSGTQNLTSNQTSNTQGNGVISGNPMGGLFGGFGSGLMGMMPILSKYFGGGGSGGAQDNGTLGPNGFTGPINPY